MSEHQHSTTLKTTDNATKQKVHINQPVSQHIHPTDIIQQARAAPGSLNVVHVLQLQRTIGNRAVAQLMSEISGLASAEQISIQHNEPEEEKELIQGKAADECLQCQPPEEEAPLQTNFASGLTGTLQEKTEASQNKTGMPDHLKSGLENISGMNLSSVRVHHNSFRPAQLNALAYTQGQEIHVGPGQEKHLPHEGWHAVQQMQGRVKQTMYTKGVSINDDAGLEREADVMGTKALQMKRVSLHQDVETKGETEVLGEVTEIHAAALTGLIQRITCQEEFGPPGTSPEPNALSVQKGAAKTRLRSNLISWDAYLIDRLRTIADGLFATEQEVAWWGNWAIGLAVDIIDEAIPKPIGTAIKAIAAAGEHIIGQSIANARARLGQAAVDSVITLRTNERIEGEDYIDQYYEELRSRTDEECAGYHDLLLNSIDEWWPELDTSALPEAQRLAQELMERVREAELVEQLRLEYEDCVRLELYRPGGVASEDEERRAREDCRQQTGYYPITAC